MQVLRELISQLNSNQIQKIQEDQAVQDSKTLQLLQIAIEEKIKTDDAAEELIFGGSSYSLDKYRKLKKRLLSLLINHFFLNNTEDKTDYATVYEDCLKKTAAVRILFSKGVQKSARVIGETTLKKALKYQIAEPCRDLAWILYIKGDTKHRTKYKALYNQYSKIAKDENFILEELNKMSLLLSKNKKPKGEVLSQIDRTFESIFSVKPESYTLSMLKLLSRTIKANIHNEHEKTFQILNEALDYFKSLPFHPPRGFLYNIFNNITPSLILTRRFEDAKQNIDQCLSLRFKGGVNWHITLYYKMILGFHSEDYELAIDCIQLARINTKELPKYIEEYWKLAELYWYFISLLGLVKYNGKIRIKRLLNEFSISNRDKDGANVSLKLMADYLIDFACGNRDSVIEQTDALRVYAYHNLRNESNQRSYIFFWIAQQLPVSDFDPEKFKSITKEKFEELKSIPAKIVDLETEFIPYETLYAHLLTLLETQSKKV